MPGCGDYAMWLQEGKCKIQKVIGMETNCCRGKTTSLLQITIEGDVVQGEDEVKEARVSIL